MPIARIAGVIFDITIGLTDQTLLFIAVAAYPNTRYMYGLSCCLVPHKVASIFQNSLFLIIVDIGDHINFVTSISVGTLSDLV